MPTFFDQARCCLPSLEVIDALARKMPDLVLRMLNIVKSEVVFPLKHCT